MVARTGNRCYNNAVYEAFGRFTPRALTLKKLEAKKDIDRPPRKNGNVQELASEAISWKWTLHVNGK